MSHPTDSRDDRPVLLFDGDCRFCRFWVDRWQAQTGGTIEFAPSETVPDDHPVMSAADLDRAIHLVEPDGRVTRGAEAAYRVREIGMARPRLARLYRKSPVFAAISEWGYRRVARNRPFFSCLTRFFFDRKRG
ncbi:MAG: DCC1-like thiol-disulfide oxidoreductase family protein [Opitutaceae bacterium]